MYGAGLALVAAGGCSGGKDGASTDSPANGAAQKTAVESTTAAGGGATGVVGSPQPTGADAPRILFMGTSLTAGYGLDDPEVESWPGAIQHIADSTGVPLHVTNAGVSGETSAGALRRAEWLFRQSYDILVIETGANDGLRGVNPDSTAQNIRAIIAKSKAARPNAPILLVQMEAPTNMGPAFTRKFHEVFPRVATETGSILLPFLLEGVGGIAKYNQGDGIHPTPEGARMAARNVWPGIKSSLQRR
jgi:acyl-CoA thioesterase-1